MVSIVACNKAFAQTASSCTCEVHTTRYIGIVMLTPMSWPPKPPPDNATSVHKISVTNTLKSYACIMRRTCGITERFEATCVGS